MIDFLGVNFMTVNECAYETRPLGLIKKQKSQQNLLIAASPKPSLDFFVCLSQPLSYNYKESIIMIIALATFDGFNNGD